MLVEFKKYIKEVAEERDEYDLDNFIVNLANDYIDSVDDVEVVTKEGGGEGGAEYCEAVFKWKEHYFKINYSYYSYNGYESYSAFDGMHEVHAVEKMVTIYE